MNNNVALACARLGSLHRFAKGVERNDVKAYQYVKRACDIGMNEACIHLNEYKPK